MSANPIAAHLRAQAAALDEEENRYGGERVHPVAATYRRAADEIDRLHESWVSTIAGPPEEKIRVTFYGGPVHGATPTLKSQPARIKVASRYTYVRVDDPDTGESLDFYAYLPD